jgi:hypothetical protein
MKNKHEIAYLLDTAESIAYSLYEAQVDVNEFQKSLTYLAKTRSISAYFNYLSIIASYGSVVIRSAQTLRYYREIYKVLLEYKSALEDIQEQVYWVLGWSARLIRYYTVNPSFKSDKAINKQARTQGQKNTIPNIGDIFTSAITAIDETAAILLIPGFAIEKVVGVLQAESLPDGRMERYREGNSARVEVIGTKTLKNGRVILELKPAPKEKTS